LANERSRKWFIEINQGAKCFETFKELLNDSWAYVLHNKDTDENGEIKTPHYHLYIEYQNARTFQAMRNRFEGAHIEAAQNREYCIQYLIHRNNPEKHQYKIDEVESNMHDINIVLEAPYFEIFNPAMILEYFKQGTTTIIAFYKRFGPYVKNHLTLLNALIKEQTQVDLVEGRLFQIPIQTLIRVVNQKLKTEIVKLEAEQEAEAESLKLTLTQMTQHTT
jgi:hypothetical protein